MRYRILVLGGYGTFGTRICRALAQDKLVRVIIAGRRIEAAQQLATKLEQALPGCRAEVAAVDIGSPEFSAKLRQLRPDAVIHTCGPFQDQDYAVARACIANAVHYIDLADSRSFVTGISALHEDAQRQGVLAVSGASSVPALSAAVVDALQTRFRQLHSIDLGISPGNRTARGLATVRSILSYCGKPFPVWRDNRWQTVHGWQGLHRRHYPAMMGGRWLGHCDVPDLALFPERYPGVHDVQFFAGLELSVLHLGTWLCSWLTRAGLVENWSRYAVPLKRISEWFADRGSTRGGMHVQLEGVGTSGKPLRLTWYLLADSDDGPQIPCTAAVLIARKLALGELARRGAFPCLGLFSLDEFMNALKHFDVQQRLVSG